MIENDPANDRLKDEESHSRDIDSGKVLSSAFARTMLRFWASRFLIECPQEFENELNASLELYHQVKDNHQLDDGYSFDTSGELFQVLRNQNDKHLDRRGSAIRFFFDDAVTKWLYYNKTETGLDEIRKIRDLRLETEFGSTAKGEQPVLDILKNTIPKIGATEKLLLVGLLKALETPDLPESAPELYPDRENRGENIIEFIRRVYFSSGRSQLPRSYLRQSDPRGYQALSNWLKQNDIPDDLSLPKKSSQYEDAIDFLLTSNVEPSDLAAKLYSIARGLSQSAPS